MRMDAVELLDTTLREGEQCYGVFFSLSTKLRLARLLDQSGVTFIEVGHPAAAPSIRGAAAGISRLELRAQLIGHARLDDSEIRLVRELGLPWVGLFSGINGLSLARYALGHAAVLERIRRSVTAAKELGLSVRFTCEDASRTGAGELTELFGRLREWGADRMSYADTVGIDTPGRLEELCRRFAGTVPFEALHFHFHNDRGRAFANAVRAAGLGARCIDASIMGVGERMGIVQLEDMLPWSDGAPASGPADLPARAAAVRTAAALVASSIDGSRFRHRRFAHKSGIHVHGVCSDPRHYEADDPAASGSPRLIVLSKLIGRTGLRALLARHGFEADEQGLGRLLGIVKSDDLLELADPEEIVRYFEENRAAPSICRDHDVPEARRCGRASPRLCGNNRQVMKK